MAVFTVGGCSGGFGIGASKPRDLRKEPSRTQIVSVSRLLGEIHQIPLQYHSLVAEGVRIPSARVKGGPRSELGRTPSTIGAAHSPQNLFWGKQTAVFGGRLRGAGKSAPPKLGIAQPVAELR